MAENANPPSPTNASPSPAPQPSPPAGGQKPDFVPEKFWDAAAGSLRTEDLARGYVKLESERGNLKPAIAKEIETERLARRPAKPDEYKIAPPQNAADLVYFEADPPADFKPEAGKRYARLNAEDPLLKFWRQHAWASGMSADEFNEGVATFVRAMVPAIPTEDQIKADRLARAQAVWKELGDNGQQRAAQVYQGLTAAVGEEATKALDGIAGSAKAIAALEALLGKSGQPRFAPQNVGQPTQAVDEPTLKAMMKDPRYWGGPDGQKRDPKFIAEVEAGWKKLYPGQVATASLGRVG